VWTFGFKRAEVLPAQANGITLLVISALIASGAISRLIHPRPVTGGVVVTVAAVGVAVNVAATWVIAKANRDSVNVRARSRTSSPTCTASSARWPPGS
jgi:cobalt-zinc-cadmium efflux system protein